MLKKRIVAFTARDGTTVLSPTLVGAPADYLAIGLGDGTKDWPEIFQELAGSNSKEGFHEAIRRVQESYMFKYGFSRQVEPMDRLDSGTPYCVSDVDELYFLAEKALEDIPVSDLPLPAITSHGHWIGDYRDPKGNQMKVRITAYSEEEDAEKEEPPEPEPIPEPSEDAPAPEKPAQEPNVVSMSDGVRELCDKRQFTFIELAPKLGVDPIALYHKLTNTPLSTEDIRIIADTLNCDVELVFKQKDTGERVYVTPVLPTEKTEVEAEMETVPEPAPALDTISKGEEISPEPATSKEPAGQKNPYLKLGVNDLMTVAPKVAEEWDYERNAPLTPEDVTKGSSKRFWWKCKTCGHHWEASVNSRTSKNGSGCPKCASEQRARKNAQKKSAEPAPVAAPRKDKPAKPAKPASSSPKKEVPDAPAKPSDLLVGINDLATVHPELAKEWHPTKNGDITPKDVTEDTIQRAYWICSDCGHEFVAYVHSRAKKQHRSGCPKCFERKRADRAREIQAEKEAQKPSRKRNEKKEEPQEDPAPEKKPQEEKPTAAAVPAGQENLRTLAVKKPQLAKEWHPTKNGNVTPNDVLVSWEDGAWWKCSECGHEWSARIDLRCKGGRCPACSEREKKQMEEPQKEEPEKEQTSNSAPENSLSIAAGDRVSHKRLGNGTVVKATPQAMGLMVEVAFDDEMDTEQDTRTFFLRPTSQSLQKI